VKAGRSDPTYIAGCLDRNPLKSCVDGKYARREILNQEERANVGFEDQ
jgi:hypothetical protein